MHVETTILGHNVDLMNLDFFQMFSLLCSEGVSSSPKKIHLNRKAIFKK